jgi:hypothetical protein
MSKFLFHFVFREYKLYKHMGINNPDIWYIERRVAVGGNMDENGNLQANLNF